MDEDTIINIDEEPNGEPQNKPHNSKDKPHNGKSIDMMEISPNGKYLVTYSKKDKTIVRWNVNKKKDDDMKGDEGKKESENVKVGEEKESEKKESKEKESVKVDYKNTVKVVDERIIRNMCVSDKRILAYIYNNDLDDKIGKIGKYSKV